MLLTVLFVAHLPLCNWLNNGSYVNWRGSVYVCEATLGQWTKVGRD